MSEDLPVGWRPGPYSVGDLTGLGVTDAALAPAVAIWREHRDAGAPPDFISGVGEGSIFDGWTNRPHDNFRTLVVTTHPPRWAFPSDAELGAPRRPSVEEALEVSLHRVLPQFYVNWGTLLLFARLWRKGALLPCLTLRAQANGEPSITLEGLETLRRKGTGAALRLLKHLRFFERLPAGGRPPKDTEEKRKAVAEWEREYGGGKAGITREQAAARITIDGSKVVTSIKNLYRWRGELK